MHRENCSLPTNSSLGRYAPGPSSQYRLIAVRHAGLDAASFNTTFTLIFSSLSPGRIHFASTFAQPARHAANATERQKAQLHDEWEQWRMPHEIDVVSID